MALDGSVADVVLSVADGSLREPPDQALPPSLWAWGDGERNRDVLSSHVRIDDTDNLGVVPTGVVARVVAGRMTLKLACGGASDVADLEI